VTTSTPPCRSQASLRATAYRADDRIHRAGPRYAIRSRPRRRTTRSGSRLFAHSQSVTNASRYAHRRAYDRSHEPRAVRPAVRGRHEAAASGQRAPGAEPGARRLCGRLSRSASSSLRAAALVRERQSRPPRFTAVRLPLLRGSSCLSRLSLPAACSPLHDSRRCVKERGGFRSECGSLAVRRACSRSRPRRREPGRRVHRLIAARSGQTVDLRSASTGRVAKASQPSAAGSARLPATLADRHWRDPSEGSSLAVQSSTIKGS